jgi:hypothetical protein
MGDRKELVQRYERGYQLLSEALARVPAEAMKWRPAPDKWSVHEIVCHCADSETNSALRLRYLVGEEQPMIYGYDQDRWARVFDYHSLPIEPSLQQIESVRRWNLELIRRLPDSAWSRSGTHSEMKDQPYTAELWLSIYAEHLEVHARQIDRNIAAWKARGTQELS